MPAHEAKWTIEPPPRLARCNRATLVPLRTPIVLTLNIFSSSSSLKNNAVISGYYPLSLHNLPSSGVKYEFPPKPMPALSKTNCKKRVSLVQYTGHFSLSTYINTTKFCFCQVEKSSVIAVFCYICTDECCNLFTSSEDIHVRYRLTRLVIYFTYHWFL